MTDANGMIPLPNHPDFEALFRPRRPTEDGFMGAYDRYVVVSFSATWCGPCKRINKKELVEHTPGVKWYAVDVDENETSLGYAGCKGVPSFVIIVDGIFKDRKTGATGAADVLLWLNQNGVPVQ
jgi:thiol-disulfide isomerase/thioredoxin